MKINEGIYILIIRLLGYKYIECDCFAAFLNPKLVVSSGACSAILRNVLDSYNLPRINESLLTTVLYLLNHPSTRCHIKSDIELEVHTIINC